MNQRWLALLVVVVFVLVRAGCEYAMMRAHGPDAQMGIWIAFMLVRVGFWLITGVVAAAVVAAAWPNRQRTRAASVLLLVWLAAVCYSSGRYYNASRALADASSGSTSPERLRALANFDGIQAGYELDNRLSLNPNSPPDLLRALHGRPDQDGTESCLAQHPNTPDDILRELAARNDSWSEYLDDALKRNPRYEEVFGDGE